MPVASCQSPVAREENWELVAGSWKLEAGVFFLSPITTHVLDTARGRPAAGVPVILERQHGDAGDGWRLVGRGETDADGRLRTLMPEGDAPPGVYRLIFDTRQYFDTMSVRAFYPQVVVVFEVIAGEAHYHMPLLLSPFGYSIYRGS